MSLSRASLALCEGGFLETILPIRVFATLTAPRQLSQERLFYSFRVWVLQIQCHEKLTLGWVRSIETRPQRHIHGALVAAAPLDCDFAERVWRRIVAPKYADAARVEPYLKGCCGLGYILKTLDTPYEGAEFSPNLSAFALNNPATHFRTNLAQRRQRRRIDAQLQAHKKDFAQ